jgi:membrane fusion protein (multidrug efflux system)
LILVAGFFIVQLSKPKENGKGPGPKKMVEKKVDGYIVSPSLLINEISVNGSLMAMDEVELKNEVAGRVVKLNLPEGKFVKKGTLLVKLFDDDLQANLKKLQAQLAVQEQIQKRQSELLKVNGISHNDYDQTTLQVNSIKAEIEVQKTYIRKTEVLAPFDGVIGLRNISVGAVVTPSTLLAIIRTNNKLKLDFYIPEKYSSEIRAGLKVKFTISNNNKLFDAMVIATEEGISADNRNLKVRAIVNNASKELIPGAFATVHLRLGEDKQAIMIPTQSIIPDENEKTVIVARNGLATIATVKTGIRQSSKIEITEGLQPGDTVITTGLLFVKENSKLLYSKISK